MIPTKITGIDSKGCESEVSVDTRNNKSGLTVFADDLFQYRQRTVLFLNPDNGRNMAVDAAASGATEPVHDGTDTALWVGSNITGGKATFDSTFADAPEGWPTNGTKSIEVDNPAVSDVWQFLSGSPVDLTPYSAFGGRVYIDKDWSIGDSVGIQGYSGGSPVGVMVLLEDYINQINFDVTQTFAISLVNMGLENETIDAIRMTLVSKTGRAPTFYMDQLTFAAGAVISYTAEPAAGKVFLYDRIEFSVAASVAGLEYDTFLGLTTANFNLQRFEGGLSVIAITYTDVSDMLSLTWDIGDVFTDAGGDTFVKFVLRLEEPSILDSRKSDKVVININSNFESMHLMNALIVGKELIE